MLEGGDRAVGLVALDVGLGGPLPRDPDVIEALVHVGQAFERINGLLEEADLARREAIGEREPEQLPRPGVRGVDVDDVAADALGLFGLVEVAVVLRLARWRRRGSREAVVSVRSPSPRSPLAGLCRAGFRRVSQGADPAEAPGAWPSASSASPDILLATQRTGSK